VDALETGEELATSKTPGYSSSAKRPQERLETPGELTQ
jgi:hypothetical protein